MCTRYGGDTERAFIKRFLRRNQRTFPEEKRRQGCAKEPQVGRKEMRMREGRGAGELFPCQTST